MRKMKPASRQTNKAHTNKKKKETQTRNRSMKFNQVHGWTLNIWICRWKKAHLNNAQRFWAENVMMVTVSDIFHWICRFDYGFRCSHYCYTDNHQMIMHRVGGDKEREREQMLEQYPSFCKTMAITKCSILWLIFFASRLNMWQLY